MVDQVPAVISIVLIDLALSGDNAVVIGMAARGLPPDLRRRAIVIGGVLAVALRVVFTAFVALLLVLPYVRVAGGLALFVVAYGLARPGGHAQNAVSAATLRGAIRAIVVADVSTSLEHVLGIGGAAEGDVALLVLGLAISIPIVLFGSGFVASLLDRFPWAVWLGVIALVWTAVDLMLDDPLLRSIVPDHWAVDVAFAALALGGIIGMLRARPHVPASAR